MPGQIFFEGYINARKMFLNYKKFGTLETSGLRALDPDLTKKRFKELNPGFNFNYKKESRPNAGYLILSFADSYNYGKPSIEIWDLNKQKKIHKYKFDFDDLSKKIGKKFDQNLTFIHPLILSDGSLIFTAQIREKLYDLVKVNKCGSYVNHNSELEFHHSIEKDNNDLIYVPSRRKKENINLNLHRSDFADEGFAILDSGLNLKQNTWLLDVYKKNNLLSDIFGRRSAPIDPFHLNDVEPYINKDGTEIALFSLRHLSTLFAIDLKTNNMIWKIDRGTLLQHDIDVINTFNGKIKISIFDNNVINYVYPKTDGNHYITIDNLPSKFNKKTLFLSDNKAHEEYFLTREKFHRLDPKYVPITKSAGRSDSIKDNNSLMIEETDHGRIFEIDLTSGKPLWQYVNKASVNEVPYMINWSRRIPKLPGRLNNQSFSNCSNI